jgi:hypothetical protein
MNNVRSFFLVSVFDPLVAPAISPFWLGGHTTKEFSFFGPHSFGSAGWPELTTQPVVFFTTSCG